MKQYELDREPYRRFTNPQRIDTAANTLRGIVEGISIDQELNAAEIAELINWTSDHGDLLKKSPFNDLGQTLKEAMKDGVIEPDEQEDILWNCRALTEGTNFYDHTTNSIQQLQGILHGILADDEVTSKEAKGLSDWIELHSDLKGTYPYDEVDSLLTAVLRDGVMDSDEQRELQHFFADFIQFSESKRKRRPTAGKESNLSDFTVRGICSVCPEIAFDGKVFTFTGKSTRGSRDKLAGEVGRLGGRFSPNVTQDTEFLVLGEKGSDCWAFTCYGRKVERAVDMRKCGHPIVIVRESDFWDAVEDFA